jgi:hypothetical protein
MVTKEELDQIQADYDAGLRADNKLYIRYNESIILGESEYQSFLALVSALALAMEKNEQEIKSSMYAASSFQNMLEIFNQEFGSRIILIAGLET